MKALSKASPTFATLFVPGSSPQEVLDRAIDLAKTLYWQHKNIPAFRQFSNEAIGYATSIQRKTTDDIVLREMSIRVKTLHYNLASFLWPGWAEPGITLTPEDEWIGHLSAVINDELATALQSGPLAESRAKWMLAGHYLRTPDTLETAESLYESAAELAQQANAPAEAASAAAFAAWVSTLCQPENPQLTERLAAALAHLRTFPDGPIFADQLLTAQKVFAAPG